MRVVPSLLALALALALQASSAGAAPSAPTSFDTYKKTFHKSYASTDLERAAEAAFLANDAIIVAHNALHNVLLVGPQHVQRPDLG